MRLFSVGDLFLNREMFLFDLIDLKICLLNLPYCARAIGVYVSQKHTPLFESHATIKYIA